MPWAGSSHVLEHLRAEDDVEGRVLRGDRLDRARSDARGFSPVSIPDDLAHVRLEEREVRHLAAADVEQPVRAEVGAGARGLAGEPACERRPHRVRRHRERRVERASVTDGHQPERDPRQSLERQARRRARSRSTRRRRHRASRGRRAPPATSGCPRMPGRRLAATARPSRSAIPDAEVGRDLEVEHLDPPRVLRRRERLGGLAREPRRGVVEERRRRPTPRSTPASRRR